LVCSKAEKKEREIKCITALSIKHLLLEDYSRDGDGVGGGQHQQNTISYPTRTPERVQESFKPSADAEGLLEDNDAIGHRSPFCEQFLIEWVFTTKPICFIIQSHILQHIFPAASVKTNEGPWVVQRLN
jgi:hypothetical protein